MYSLVQLVCVLVAAKGSEEGSKVVVDNKIEIGNKVEVGNKVGVGNEVEVVAVTVVKAVGTAW